MISGQHDRLAHQNLLETYTHLGLAVPGAQLVQEEGFQYCVGPLNHPLNNFAANLNLNPWAARRLRELAEQRSSFNVFVLPGDRPDELAELLHRADFQVSYRLIQMIADPVANTDCEPMAAVQGRLRQVVARFMANQFFPRNTEEFRTIVANATADLENLELFSIVRRGRMLGSLLVHETEGFLGCYNLCVDSAFRGRGIGSSMVKWLRAEAGDRRLPVGVQCDPSLEGWYSGLGFRRTGWVDVYHLSKLPPSDIIGGS